MQQNPTGKQQTTTNNHNPDGPEITKWNRILSMRKSFLCKTHTHTHTHTETRRKKLTVLHRS